LSRAFLEELTVTQLIKKFTTIHGTRWPITVPTRARTKMSSEPSLTKSPVFNVQTSELIGQAKYVPGKSDVLKALRKIVGL
jgi:hypothetical protein